MSTNTDIEEMQWSCDQLAAKVDRLKERAGRRAATARVDGCIRKGKIAPGERETQTKCAMKYPGLFEEMVFQRPALQAKADGTFVRIDAVGVGGETMNSVEQMLCKHFHIQPAKFVAMRKNSKNPVWSLPV
jgi:hypothetical protein